MIVNENDTVSTDEIKVGDNDTLAASIATAIQADLFVILTTKKACSLKTQLLLRRRS